MGVYTVNQTDGSLVRVAGGMLYADAPIGAIQSYGGETAPAGWLICDGSAVSRTDYEDLFNVIGTAFGTGDGSTTFNLPDLREAVPKGAGLTGKTVGAHLDADGLAVGEFLDDRVENISGSYDARVMRAGSTDYDIVVDPQGAFKVSDKPGASYGYVNSSGQTTKINHITFDSSNVARTGDTTEVKSVGVNYIIKAKQVGMPTDFASAVGDIAVDKNTYSTSETIVGKWIDGKPIYRVVRHVWDVGNVPATGYSFSGTTLSGPLTNNAESIIKVVILCKNNQGSWQELTGNGEGGPTQNFVWISDTSAYFINGGVLAGAWAIFEYTKTTD